MAGSEVMLVAGVVSTVSLLVASEAAIRWYSTRDLSKKIGEMWKEIDRDDEKLYLNRSRGELEDDVLSYWSNRPEPAGANATDEEIREFARPFSIGMLDGFESKYFPEGLLDCFEDCYMTQKMIQIRSIQGTSSGPAVPIEPPQLTEAQQKVYEGGRRLGGHMAALIDAGRTFSVLNLKAYETPESLEERIVDTIKKDPTRPKIESFRYVGF